MEKESRLAALNDFDTIKLLRQTGDAQIRPTRALVRPQTPGQTENHPFFWRDTLFQIATTESTAPRTIGVAMRLVANAEGPQLDEVKENFERLLRKRYSLPERRTPVSSLDIDQLEAKELTAVSAADALRQQEISRLGLILPGMEAWITHAKQARLIMGQNAVLWEQRWADTDDLFHRVIPHLEYNQEAKSARTLTQMLQVFLDRNLTTKARLEAAFKLTATDLAILDAASLYKDSGATYELFRILDRDSMWDSTKKSDELVDVEIQAAHNIRTGECICTELPCNTTEQTIVITHTIPCRTLNIGGIRALATGRTKLRERGLGKLFIKDGDQNRDYEGTLFAFEKDEDIPVFLKEMGEALVASGHQFKFKVDKNYMQNIFEDGFKIELSNGQEIPFDYSENGKTGTVTAKSRKSLKFFVEIDGKQVEIQMKTIKHYLNSEYSWADKDNVFLERGNLTYQPKDTPDFHEGYYVDKLWSGLLPVLFNTQYWQYVQNLARIPVEKQIEQINNPEWKYFMTYAEHEAKWGNLVRRAMRHRRTN